MTENGGLRQEELRELLLETYLEVRIEQEDKNNIPKADQQVTIKYRRFFEILGALHLGLLVACMTIFIELVILRMILHLDL